MKPALQQQPDTFNPSVQDMLSPDYEVREALLTKEGLLPSSIEQALEVLNASFIQHIEDESEIPAQCTGEWLGDRGLSDLNRHNITIYEGADGKIVKQISTIALDLNRAPKEHTAVYVIQSKPLKQKDDTHRAILRLVEAA